MKNGVMMLKNQCLFVFKTLHTNPIITHTKC